MRQSISGFTTIELLIVVVIIAILAAISYPAYTNYVFRVNRSDGQRLLLQVASEQERHYTQFNRYAMNLASGPPAGLGMTSQLSENGYYRVSANPGPSGDNQTFLLTAVPQGRQSSDACGNLTLTSTGTKAFSGSQSNGRCW